MTREQFYTGRADTATRLRVASIFLTIDGETSAYHQGSWSVFLRLQGCRVGCVWCFGVKHGKRVPRVTLARPKNQTAKERLDRVQVGDVILTLDEQHNLVETTITALHSRKVHNWYEVEINSGYTQTNEPVHYFITPEHPLSTTRGWVEAKDLVRGDVLFQVPWQEILTYQKTGERNPNYIPETYTPNLNALKKQLSGNDLPCESCSKVARLEVHHLDGNDKNDDTSNLAAICHACHSKYHKRGFNFWNGRRTDGKRSPCAEIDHNGAEVVSVRRVFRDPKVTWWRSQGMAPDLTVYNLTCAPYNTFLLDRMWVHNCDTRYSWPIDKGGEMMTPSEILSKITTIGRGVNKLTLTGGEPMEQWGIPLSELLARLHDRNYHVSMETAGCDDLQGLIAEHPQVNIVADYKLDSSGRTRPPHLPSFALLRTTDVVKIVCTLSEMPKLPDTVDYLRTVGCVGRIVFSPVRQDGRNKNVDSLVAFVDKARELGLDSRNVGLNLQLHKIIWDENFREEEL